MKKRVIVVSLIMIIIAVLAGAFYLLKDQILPQPQKITIVGLGDSLTFGVGATEGHNYLSRIEAKLAAEDDIETVTAINYGVTGNTSTQINGRLHEDKQLQKDIKKADIVTITAGGNDLMAVVKKSLLRTTADSFVGALKTYEKQVNDIIATIRKKNPTAQIYVLGIYNPFTQILGDNAEANAILDSWNAALTTISKQKNVTFVPVAKEFKAAGADYISTVDQFHPNDAGYALMAKKLYAKIKEQ